MGLLDRVKKVAEGIGSVMTAPAEFVWDVANGAFTDAELDLWSEVKGEVGEALEGAFSGDRGLGAAIGGVPKPARRAVPNAVGAVLEAGEDAYGVVSKTLARGAAQRATATNVGTVGISTGRSLRRAEVLAEGRSPGQVAALGLSADVWDDQAIENREDSWGFSVASGVVDAVIRLSPLDPLNAVAIGGIAARARYIDTAVSRVGIDAAMDSRRTARFLDKIEDKNASQIVDQFFSNHPHGGQIGHLLSEGDRSAKAHTLRALMGDGDAFRALETERADIAHQLTNLMGENAHLWDEGTLFHNADDVARVEREMDALYPAMDRVDMSIDLSGAVQTIPRYSRVGEVRSAVGRSVTYQNSPLTRPLKVITNKMPHHWVDVNDGRSHNQAWRQLRDSRLPVEEQDRLRAAVQAAPNPAARQRAIVEADEAAVRSVLDHHGLAQDDIDLLLANHREARNGAMGALRGRKYDAGPDGMNPRGVVEFTDIDGTEVKIALPLYVTQQADLIPLSDLGLIDHLGEMISGSFLKRTLRGARENNQAVRLPTEALDQFMRLWRPSVLLRFGWPQRILLDEQLRVMSEIGVFATLAKLPRGFKTLGDRTGSFAARYTPGLRNADAVAREAVDTRAIARLDRPVTVGGVEYPSAFGAPGDPANLFLGQGQAAGISARGTIRELVEGERAQNLANLRKHTGNFKVHHPTDDDYDAMWGWAVNKHIRQDPLGMQMLSSSIDDGVRWLTETPEGIAHARQMGWRPHTFRSHVDDIDDQIGRYLPGDLRAEAATRELSSTDLHRAIPDEALAPVHGEELVQALGKKGELGQWIGDMVRGAYNALGTVPTDVLSRQPFFDHLYRREIARLTDLAITEGVALDAAARVRIAGQARKSALDDTQRLLYDLAERSEFTEILRFMSPFYSAFQEVAVTWARQTWKNPAFTARARYVWAAPEKAGLVTDENGNVITDDGAENPLTGAKAKAGSERFITLPFAVPGLPGQMSMSANKKSFNLILSGPGGGPVIQVPVNEIVKDRPDLASSLEWVLPFGSTQETFNLLLPATARRLNQTRAGEEDRVYRNTMIRMLYDRQVEFREANGRYPNADERGKMYRQVKSDTNSLFKIRAVASYILPFAPIFDSPYKPYIDTYRQMQQRVREGPDTVGGRSALIADEHGNPRSVDEWFYDEYGPEFLPLAQSLSSSRDGVMPTIEGWRAREEYRDLIERFPEIGGFIIGAEGAGEFNRSVYDMQLSTPVRPGSGTPQRETPSVEEAAVKPEIAEGWLRYGRAMDLIEAVRVDRGLPSLSVAAAGDLSAIKRAVTAQIAREFPSWWEAYNQSDRLAFQKRLDGLQAVVGDERFRNRLDVQGVAQYLQARSLVLETLAQRGKAGGAKTLTATSNQDVALVWDAVKASLVERNLAFADVYYRFLERDPMGDG